MRKISILTVICVLLSFGAAFAKVGVFDFQKVMNESEQGKSYFKQVMAKGKKYDAQLKDKATKFQQASDSFKKQIQSMTQEAADKKKIELNRQYRDLQDQKNFFQNELKRFQTTSMQQIQETVVKIVQKLGQELGYDLILEKQQGGVVYFSNKIDITNIVIERFNKESKK